MKKLLLSCLALCTFFFSSAQDVEVAKGKYKPDWENLAQWECPEWFKDAKFGIWAHWGPQCQAEAGDWYARHMYYDGEWQANHHVKTYGSQSEYGFKDLCNDWKAEKWNPEELIKLYKSVGAKYFFTLGQHHGNFDLWDSPYQEWNSVNVGPKRDIVKEWAEACKKHGLPFGVSMHGSHTWTWMEGAQKYDGNLTKEDGYKLNPDGTEKWWKGLDPQELYAQRHEHSTGWERVGTIHSQWNWGNGASQPSKEYKMKFQNRVLECVNTFKPDMLYFDDTVLPFYGCDESVGLNILSHFYNTSAQLNGGEQQVVVMGKVLESQHKEAMLWDVERGTPDRAQEKYWQTCTCIGGWHYNRYDYNAGAYKSAQQVISMLVDIVSKNGNMLLSVPIRGDGSLDEKEMEILMGIKAWMDVNSESIYATRPWKTFGEGPLAEGSNPINAQGFNESNNYSAEDIRFVKRDETLFATTLRYPDSKQVVIKSLGMASRYYSGEVKSVELLGYGAVEFKNDIEGLVITMPEEKVNPIAAVFAIEFGENKAGASLAKIVEIYEQKALELKSLASPNTGKFATVKVEGFAKLVAESKRKLNADDQTKQTAVDELHKAYANLKAEGQNVGGEPIGKVKHDYTEELLVEAKSFARKGTSTTRFGEPKNWTVENFNIPNGRDGVKRGLDKYEGNDALMLGVWNDRGVARNVDLENARIYRTVTLKPGIYYFGAKFNATYSLSDEAYIFASGETLETKDIPAKSIAYWELNRTATDGKFHGIYFTVKRTQTITLGFQANLKKGSHTQEFRADEVKLISLQKGKAELSSSQTQLAQRINPFGNALVPDMTADASVIVEGDTFYYYATTDGYGRGLETSGPAVVWKSKDFVNWSFSGSYFPSAKNQKYWAPSKAIAANGKWYIYPTINGYMYAAVASSPEGPFRLARGEDKFELPYSEESTLRQGKDRGGIDAEVFIDDDGQAYMFWGMRHVARLKPDMITLEDVTTLTTARKEYSEGPIFFKRKGIYYYLYTIGGDERYEYYYMMSRVSPLGPYITPENNRVSTTNISTGVFGPGHGCVFNDGDDYYFAFLEFGRNSTNRQSYVNRMEFNKDGTIRPVEVTLDGVGALRKPTKPKRLRPISVIASSEKSPMAIRHFKDERCKRTESFGASFVIDGANGSRWMAAEDDAKNQLTMDLGKVKMIKESEIYFVRPTAGHAYVLEGSLDGVNWTTCGGHSDKRMQSPHSDKVNAKYRYLRLTITDGVKGVWEWKIY